MTALDRGWAGVDTGFSLVELVVGIVVLAAGLLVLAGTITGALHMTSNARDDLGLWSAVQWKADSLEMLGRGNVTSSSDTVQGRPVTWTVSGANQEKVEMVVGADGATPQTIVIYLK